MRGSRLGTLLVLTLAAAACSGEGRSPVAPAPMPGQNGTIGGGMGGSSMMVGSEFEYLAGMIPHHEEAIASAKVLRDGTARPEMRAFAEDIIAAQSREVTQMTAWLADWYPGRSTAVAYDPMMRDLSGLAGGALDRAFLEDMIPHHMMAVMMSQQLTMRRLVIHAAVTPFATNIRDTQMQEIHRMRAWLWEWFGVAAPMM